MATNPWQFPLSGDVTQAFNPFSYWVSGGQQAGFININTTRTGNPRLERRIVEEVASYGRQLGRIIDALDVVVAHLPADDLTPREQDAIDAFVKLADQIAAVKNENLPSPMTPAKLDRVIADVRALEQIDSGLYIEMVARIQAAFPPETP